MIRLIYNICAKNALFSTQTVKLLLNKTIPKQHRYVILLFMLQKFGAHQLFLHQDPLKRLGVVAK